MKTGYKNTNFWKEFQNLKKACYSLNRKNAKKIDKLSEILEQTTKILDFQKKSITQINKKLKNKKPEK